MLTTLFALSFVRKLVWRVKRRAHLPESAEEGILLFCDDEDEEEGGDDEKENTDKEVAKEVKAVDSFDGSAGGTEGVERVQARTNELNLAVAFEGGKTPPPATEGSYM